MSIIAQNDLFENERTGECSILRSFAFSFDSKIHENPYKMYISFVLFEYLNNTNGTQWISTEMFE
jgi:hypothetical protein